MSTRRVEMPHDRRLLLAEDEESWCTLTAKRLRSAGWKVFVAYDGDAALKLYEEHATTLSVVVSDLKMPGLQGEDLLRLIRGRDARLPLVAITGEPDRAAHLRALTTGAYLFLEKPFDPAVFDAYLDNAHHLYELQCDIQQARAREQQAARLFRQFVISDSPRRVIASRRIEVGGLGLEITSHSFDTDRPGGDYVEWFSRGSEEVVFCVGDASGHGELVGTLMACLSTIVLHRSHHLGRPGVEEMVSLIDQTFLELKSRGGIDAGRFMCLFLGTISLLSGRLVYINAGHTEGFLMRADAMGQAPSVQRLPIHTGAAALFPSVVRRARPFTEHAEQLRPGDILIIFTDGASEFLGSDDGGPSAGMARLEKAALDLYQTSAAGTLAALVAWLEKEAGPDGLEDDATLLVIRVLSAAESRAGATPAGVSPVALPASPEAGPVIHQ
jgi:DNA-binding response OmpR family regulator